MTAETKLAYYPGCTLKTKALGLEDSALASLKELGIDIEEMPRWNCCGAVFSLADDDLIHQIAPVRDLIRAQENGADTIVTLCSQCYNTLARANILVREDEVKRDTVNRFMDEEADYKCGVEVVHYLTFLRDNVGFDKLRESVKKPLTGLKVAPFYGCTLLRPNNVAIDAEATILQEFLSAIGAEPVDFAAANECCGSYQGLANPEAGLKRGGDVVGAANRAGADALVLSCPLCEYNLGTRQPQVMETVSDLSPVPTYYFTQLLAVALGLEADVCHFELSDAASLNLMKKKKYVA
jgi:heterodisulfide reductase subunit B2